MHTYIHTYIHMYVYIGICIFFMYVCMYATNNNIYGPELFTKKALVVDRLQIAFDPLDVVADNAALDEVVKVDLQDSSLTPNPPSDTDDTVSSDDDDASKAMLSELLQSSPVPGFNPLRVDPLSANQVPYPAAAPASAGDIKTAVPPASSVLLDRFASDEVQDAPLRRGSRSRKDPSRISNRVVRKSATSGKPLASSRPAVTAQSLVVNKLLFVGHKLKRFFPHFWQLRRQGQHV
jgi:hypothetical protein